MGATTRLATSKLDFPVQASSTIKNSPITNIAKLITSKGLVKVRSLVFAVTSFPADLLINAMSFRNVEGPTKTFDYHLKSSDPIPMLIMYKLLERKAEEGSLWIPFNPDMGVQMQFDYVSPTTAYGATPELVVWEFDNFDDGRANFPSQGAPAPNNIGLRNPGFIDAVPRFPAATVGSKPADYAIPGLVFEV